MSNPYDETMFRLNEGDLPAHFWIVTAFNPDGVTVTPETNLGHDARLRARVVADGWLHFRVTGLSPDEKHAEPGWGIDCPRVAAFALGAEFNQQAIFEVDGDELELWYVADDRELTLGSFRRRVIGALTAGTDPEETS
ncbi:MAG: DUF3293 domain-containing protein [Gammaproteobacteria bacterium]|nr:DUF3293 domain-containing protein [Gammaproteobacteria bacterium]